MVYQNSAASAGMAVGGFFFHVLSRRIDRPAAMLWSIIGLLLAQMWSALMTGKGDYIPYLVSRAVSGFFGTVVGVLGPQMLIDMFFLHQRGRAFTFFFFWFDLGTMAAPLSALIADGLGWPSGFWWTVILCGLSTLTILCFLSDTTWDRRPGASNRAPARLWAWERVETFFPGTRIKPKTSFVELVSFEIVSRWPRKRS